MVKLDVMKILHCAINSEAGIVLSLFLIFGDFEPQCFYKIVHYNLTNNQLES